MDLHYTHPRLAQIYDLGNSGAWDRDFYIALAGPPPQDILDLGCGTGLLCDAYAARGHRVVGLDPAAAMLDVARGKPNGEKIDWIESRAEDFRSDRRFDLIIMTGHAFQVLLTDVQVLATLEAMSVHLKPGGRAVFESRNPAIDWDQRWARTRCLEGPEGDIHASRRLIEASPDKEFIHFAWDYVFTDATLTSESRLRFLTHERIIALASSAGLELSALYGDWHEGEFDAKTSAEMIFKFKRAPRR